MKLCNKKKLKIQALKQEIKDKEIITNEYIKHHDMEMKKAQMAFQEKLDELIQENKRQFEKMQKEQDEREKEMLRRYQAIFNENQTLKSKYQRLEEAIARKAELVVKNVLMGAMAVIKTEQQQKQEQTKVAGMEAEAPQAAKMEVAA